MIESVLEIVGLPVIVFYCFALVVLVKVYQGSFKTFFSFLYALVVISFNTSLWEFPVILAIPGGLSHDFVTMLSYWIPLPLFVLVYNIKFDWSRRKSLMWVVWLLVEVGYVLLMPVVLPDFWSGLGMYYDVRYLSTFVLRGTSLVVLSYSCIPNVEKCRFSVGKKE